MLEVQFHKPPTPLELHEAVESGTEDAVGTERNPFVPMRVVADINGDGLGLTSWWAQAEANEGEEDGGGGGRGGEEES